MFSGWLTGWTSVREKNVEAVEKDLLESVARTLSDVCQPLAGVVRTLYLQGAKPDCAHCPVAAYCYSADKKNLGFDVQNPRHCGGYLFVGLSESVIEAGAESGGVVRRTERIVNPSVQRPGPV